MASLGQKVRRTAISTNKLDMVRHFWNLSYTGGTHWVWDLIGLESGMGVSGFKSSNWFLCEANTEKHCRIFQISTTYLNLCKDLPTPCSCPQEVESQAK
jgi:hypothetical protein